MAAFVSRIDGVCRFVCRVLILRSLTRISKRLPAPAMTVRQPTNHVGMRRSSISSDTVLRALETVSEVAHPAATDTVVTLHARSLPIQGLSLEPSEISNQFWR